MDNYSLELDELLNSQQKFSVHSLYHFISPWLNKFTALEKEKGTSFWLTALIKMHRDYAQCLERYFPFLKSSEQLFSAKDLTKFSVRELVRAYLELQRNLDDSASAETKRLIKAGLKHTVLLYLRICRLQRQLERVAYGMDFKPLFDCQKSCFPLAIILVNKDLINPIMTCWPPKHGSPACSP